MKYNLNLIKKTMSSIEIADLADREHKNIMRDIRSMEPAWEKVTGLKFELSEYKDSTGRTLPCYELNYQECMYIASKFNDETRAKLVLRWNALETGESEPIIASGFTEAKEQLTISDKMKAATWAAKFLNLNESSKLIIAKQILEPLDLPLPDYTPSYGVLRSATELLKSYGLDLTARVFNQYAMAGGLITETRRTTSKGKDKYFKVITGKGLEYGENQVCPNNPKESQPLWHENKFGELLERIGLL